MKKIILIFSIFFLIILTTLTKNSSKKLENKIFNSKENIRILQDKYDYALLDYNFLTTPKKLMGYQFKYFENNLIPIDINKIKNINKKKNQLIISEFNQKIIENE